MSNKRLKTLQLPKGRRTKQFLKGGPYDGQSLKMYSAGTLPFSACGWFGKYNIHNEWVEL